MAHRKQSHFRADVDNKLSRKELFQHMLENNIDSFVVEWPDVTNTYYLERDRSISCFNSLGYGVERFKLREDGKWESWLEFTSFAQLSPESAKNAKKYNGTGFIFSYF